RLGRCSWGCVKEQDQTLKKRAALNFLAINQKNFQTTAVRKSAGNSMRHLAITVVNIQLLSH
ncbi:hypothetical protein, partial [Pseudomonas amygdali]|uniref:hypothetical protein n=1 Tax=Pseudomonas amygdali TaxID=47877 RepID=UPI001F359BE1